MTSGTDWTTEEVTRIVDDYFDMLRSEVVGEPYSKTSHRQKLREILTARSDGSIEFKHQNISAVLNDLGLRYIHGYKPRTNRQKLLEEAVNSRLAADLEFEATLRGRESAWGRTWSGDVSAVIELLPEQFTLAQVYAYEDALARAHPDNHHVQSHIRHNLQLLADRGIIEFVDRRGTYRKLERHPQVSQSDEVDLAAQITDGLARGTAIGQGFAVSAKVRRAIEARAMALASAYYSSRWPSVEDVSRQESYDLCCTDIAGVDLHVEVKGTTGRGDRILLTPLEVEHARSYPRCELFIASGITVDESGDEVIAAGGATRVLENWTVAPSSLMPTGYAYTVSASDVEN